MHNHQFLVKWSFFLTNSKYFVKGIQCGQECGFRFYIKKDVLDHIWRMLYITFFKGGPTNSFLQWKQHRFNDFCPRWTLIHFKLKSRWKKLLVLIVTNHNILNQHWEGTLASPNMQQTRKIKNRNVECMVDPMGPHLSDPYCSWQTPSSHQLYHEQLWDQAHSNASHIQIEFKWSQVSGASIFLLSLEERVTSALFKNVMIEGKK
jgi:hypothetical protein